MEMPEKNRKAKGTVPLTATELCAGGIESEPFRLGRKLILKFIGGEHPELDRIEFRWSLASKTVYWQQGDPDNQMSWTKVPQALALVFLCYLTTDEKVGPVFFCGDRNGSLAASLGDAITDKYSKLHELLIERVDNGVPSSRVRQIFAGTNIHGKDDGERRIFIRSDNLPPDCIEIYWVLRGPGRITDLEVVRTLAQRIRKDLGISGEATLPEGKESVPPGAAPATTPEPALSAKPQQPKQGELPGVSPKAESKPPPQASPEKEAPTPKAKDACPKTDATAGEAAPKTAPQPEEEKTAPIPPINRRLFEIHNPLKLCWDDNHPLLDFGEDGSKDDIWRLKDACEGVLIFGAPSSGKTSGSGNMFSQAFLAAGFGGLVMTAKTDEAKRWVRRCARAGRADDCVLVSLDGPHKLNVLAYESQRPRKQIGLTHDLISFFRILIAVVSKRAASGAMEEFWINATDQLMRNLFDVFLLAGEPLTIDGLIKFVTVAPQKRVTEWQDIPFFSSLLLRADKAATSPEDRRIYKSCLDYWTVNYPGIANATRSGITTGFTAMADVLSGRGIHELISGETTLTPESILSGKIVILDLSLKDCGQGGLLIQAAWKYLLQKAIERRSDKGLDTARPVFIWEDEGHMFYSKHDIDFQPTARDCRAAHIIISQSLHNFYQLGHSKDAILGVFATMNTQVFHANGDLETNQWASEKIGTEITTLVDVSFSQEPKKEDQPRHWFWDMGRPRETEPKSSSSVKQQRDKVIQPEQFAMLKKGGDGFCEAVVSWLSHPFKANKDRPFCLKVFKQEEKE